MNKSLKRQHRAAIFLAALVAFLGFAATSASAQVPTLCISRLNDLSTIVLPGSGAINLSDSSILVEKRRNQPGVGNENYSVTARGSGPGGSFSLLGPGGALLPYSVFWAGSAGVTTTTAATQLTANQPLSATGAFLQAQGTILNACNATAGRADNASVIVHFNALDLNAAFSGEYNGTLTLMVGAP